MLSKREEEFFGEVQAFLQEGNAALLETQRHSDGKRVLLICATHEYKDPKKGRMTRLHPLAEMLPNALASEYDISDPDEGPMFSITESGISEVPVEKLSEEAQTIMSVVTMKVIDTVLERPEFHSLCLDSAEDRQLFRSRLATILPQILPKTKT